MLVSWVSVHINGLIKYTESSLDVAQSLKECHFLSDLSLGADKGRNLHSKVVWHPAKVCKCHFQLHPWSFYNPLLNYQLYKLRKICITTLGYKSVDMDIIPVQDNQ